MGFVAIQGVEERCFASAVGADDADPVARTDDRSPVSKQEPATDPLFECIEAKQQR